MSAAPPPLPAAAAASASPPDLAPGRWQRWSDWLNPILVREVQQAVKGRAFAVTVWLALVIAVAIAAHVASHYQPGRSGRDAFHAGFATLMPLLVFVVPMQAYQSMRLELRSGIVEQLLVSRLRPLHILFGKLQAAMVQFVVYVAVMAPLLATSYLLRGVDVPTIAISLGFALLACLTATAVSVSSAAQAVLPGMQTMASLATAFGLGMAAFACVGFIGSGEYAGAIGFLLRSPQFWAVMTAILLAAAVAITMSLLVARSFLVHAFENKSTGFRVLLFVLPLLAIGWVLVFLEPANWERVLPPITYGLLVVGIAFALMMVTEQRELSPRLRAHAPKSTLTGLLAAPFLPGRDRGAACFCLFVLVLTGVWLAWPAAASSTWTADMQRGITRLGAMTLAYALAWLTLGRWLRGRLPATVQGNHLARLLVPVAFFLAMLVPALFDVFARQSVGQWHLGHLLNPVWTIEEFAFAESRWPMAQVPVWIAIAVGLALQLPALLGGVREVLAAGAARTAPQRDG